MEWLILFAVVTVTVLYCNERGNEKQSRRKTENSQETFRASSLVSLMRYVREKY